MRRFVATAAILVAACSSSDSADAGGGPLVGPMELPLSLRVGPAFRSDGALRVDIGSSEIRLDGQPLVTLSEGDVPAGELGAEGVTKLAAAVRGKANRERAAIYAHAMVPYRTTVQVLTSLLAAGVRQVGFAVRRLGGSLDPAWIALGGVRVAPANEEEVAIEGALPTQWDDFVRLWEEITNACNEAPSSDCSRRPEYVATGGRLQITLLARGDGLSLQFLRVGAPPPAPVAPPRADPETERMGVTQKAVKLNRRGPAAIARRFPDAGTIDPSIQGLFTMRAEQTTRAPSPVTGILRPICGTRACGVVAVADALTPTGRVISLLGAAFPDGTDPPVVAFRVPR